MSNTYRFEVGGEPQPDYINRLIGNLQRGPDDALVTIKRAGFEGERTFFVDWEMVGTDNGSEAKRCTEIVRTFCDQTWRSTHQPTATFPVRIEKPGEHPQEVMVTASTTPLHGEGSNHLV